MNLSTLEMAGLLAHAGTKVTLPDAGVVVVTGPNGAGKSSLLEAVSWGLWGKTLRGESPADDGVACSVELALPVPGIWVRRGRSAAGRTVLLWGPFGQPATAWETTTKAQEALEQVVGSWEVWRRTSVFSSSDAAHFSGATDKERKLLLEAVLGLGRYDAALEACRAELRRAESSAAEAATASIYARRAVEDAKAALEASPPPAPVGGDPEALREEAAKVDKMAASALREGQAARAAQRAAAVGGSESRGRLGLLQQRLGALHGKAACPTCTQPVPAALVAGFAEEVKREAAAVRAAEDAATAKASEYRVEAEEAEQEERNLRSRAAGLRVQAAQVEGAQRAAEAAGRARERAAARLAEAEKDVAARAAAEAAAGLRLLLLQQVTVVLGLRGVRAHILGRALDGLQAAAGTWLRRLSGSRLGLRVSAYAEKKTGGLSDAISVRVTKDGGPERPYGARSGGERRLVDVSLLLALGDAAGAAAGRAAGILCLDEVFDALDEEWTAGVAAALGEIGAGRQVVVITHSESLARALPAAARWRVDGGRVAR